MAISDDDDSAGQGLQVFTDALRRQQAELAERLRPIVEAQSAAVAAWSRVDAPLIEALSRVRAAAAAAMPSSAIMERLEWLRRERARGDAMEAAGWMAHPSSPFHLLEAGLSEGELAAAIEDYYRQNRNEVASAMRARVDACSIDEEAKATFAEALAAHGAGMFRCAPRLLFPELERVARRELHGGAMDKMASQEGLQKAVGSLTPMEMEWTGSTGLRFYRKLTEHMYQSMRDPAAVEGIRADPVPNRHAALHGYVSYAAANTSFNALASAEYLLMAISVIKEAGADGEAPRG